MRNTVLASVVVGRQAELCIRGLSSNKLGSGLLSGGTSPQSRDSRIGIDLGGVLVLGLDDHTELVQVDSTARKRVRTASMRVGMDAHSGQGGQSGDESGTHIKNERLGTRVNDERLGLTDTWRW